LAASEHEWPLATGHDGIDAIPSANPLQNSLLETGALLADAADEHVEADGQLGLAPGDAEMSDALDEVAAILDAASQAFDVALSGETPAATANPIRSPEPAGDAEEPDEPADGSVQESGDPVEVDEEVPSQNTESTLSGKPQAPAGGPRARAPRQQVSRRDQAAEAPGGQSSKTVVAHDDPPRQARTRGKEVPPTIEDAVAARLVAVVSGKSPAYSDMSATATKEPGAQEQAVHREPRDYTSTMFWTLMDRWKMSDAEALALIGHAGGMTKKGTRPRFKVVGREAKLFGQLREIDAALSPLVDDAAAWIRQPIKEAPFRGQSVVAHITQHGSDGAREVERMVLMTALRQHTSA
jgi:hypothetical protein